MRSLIQMAFYCNESVPEVLKTRCIFLNLNPRVFNEILRIGLKRKRISHSLIGSVCLLCKGWASWSVSSLSFLKSITILHFCFPEASIFFGTTQTGKLQSKSYFSIIFLSNISFICFSISALWHSGSL